MANQTGRPVAPARKLVAAVMGTIAVFVVALGLGMSSWGVVVFGLAVLALSIALGMVNVVRRGARAWVSGTAEVKVISPPPTSSAVYGRAEIQAVVVAPGLPTSEVTIREPRIPVVKWPMPGDTLPITVDVDDMRRVRINWDDASPRERGDDPPPPAAPDYGDPEDLPDDLADDLDDDLLGDVDPPPWAARDRQWEGGPPPPPPAATGDTSVVIHDTPAGPIVEGEFVDHNDDTQPLPRRAAKAGGFTAGFAGSPGDDFAAEPGDDFATDPASAASPSAAAAAAAAGTAAAGRRTTGRRPSPHPRGGTATATAEPLTDDVEDTLAPPSQRIPHDDPIPVDIPLDEPQPPPTPGAASTGPAAPLRRPEPTATSTTATPSPVTPFPTAPEPMTPPPAAPQPSTDRPSAPQPTAFDDIDLPLDGDPDPAPEVTDPRAREAMAEGLIAPPASYVPPTAADRPADPAGATRAEAAAAPESRATTKFVSNAAHDAESPAESAGLPNSAAGSAAAAPDAPAASAPAPAASAPAASAPGASAPADKSASTGVVASAAAAVGAVAAAAVAAVKRVGRSDKDEQAEPVSPEPPSTAPATSEAAPTSEGTTDADAAPISDAGAGSSDANPWSTPPPVSTEPDEHADDLITAYPSARPGPAGAIYGVGITVLVTDLGRSIAFYRDTLGFYEIDSGDGSAVLASGDTRLVLRTVSGLSAEAGRLIYLNLEVGDVEAVYTELSAKGVTFVHPPQPVNRGDRLELWSATFRDPDDHNIAITQWRAIR